MKALEHLRTINHHKLLVMKGCFKVGLYKQGLLHDLSKYSPAEFLVGCRYFQGNRSPNNAEREATGVSTAWLHHKGRNKHHYEYWIDYTAEKERLLAGSKMPVRYVIEMFMDRVAASKTYQKENYQDCHPLEYYEQGAAKLGNMVHKDTAALLHHLLKMLAEQGEEKTFAYIRRVVLKNKRKRRFRCFRGGGKRRCMN
ncbi:MAG: catalase [Dorea sp.]|nr:catalase [Dorea sp.]